MNLDYLKPYADNVNLEALTALKKERLTWRDHKGREHCKEALDGLPSITPSLLDFSKSHVTVGQESDLTEEQRADILERCKKLIPWRKGPFNLFGIDLDAEWRSDFKWERLKSKVDNLEGKKILDIGCNNGYFMFKMLEQNPELVMGIDPMVPVEAQFRFINHFIQSPKVHLELFGIEHIEHFKNLFDVVFSMGIIYHHRNPIQQLLDIQNTMAPGGQLILETIGIPGGESYALFPEDRYAKMKNVWFVPTLECFLNWARRAKFVDVEVISSSLLDFDEQRLTKWCPPPYQSLEDFLDPNNRELTVEGHPAPMRFCISARKRAR